MRKILYLFLSLILIPMCVSFAQGYMDYVSEVKGDTLVVKDYVDMGNQASSLTNVVTQDNQNVPAGRVYELKANGYYPLAANLTTPSDRAVVIVGEDNTRLVNNKNAASAPPIICGSTIAGAGTNTGAINFANNLTVKNCNIIPGASDGTEGWAFFGSAAPHKTLICENDLMEHTRWVFYQSNDYDSCSFYFKDCYFVNMSGYACRRNGGVYDNVNHNTDTMYVENCTHVMAQGSMYKLRNYPVGRAFFNHNTFLNCAGSVFETQGYNSNMIVTNNIFVNSNEQPYMPGLDPSETDPDNLPTGLIDVTPLLSTMKQVPRKFLVEANVDYWDPRISDLAPQAVSMDINHNTNWKNQAIKMNSRTQSMFDDNTNYPYLTEGIWYDKLPNFTDPKDLLTGEVDSIKTWCIGTVDTLSTNILQDFRLVYTDYPNDYIYSDWPIPINLSYSDADLMVGGTDGLPVGDLNWFPDKKATFLANIDQFHAALENALQGGKTVLAVKELGGEPMTFNLAQNYPNPFNPTTTIDFTIPKAGNVTLKIYDALGREVATLVNGYMTAQAYKVDFNGSNLSNGVYFYTLRTDNFSQTKKMVLLK
jgi:hypothetical protein